MQMLARRTKSSDRARRIGSSAVPALRCQPLRVGPDVDHGDGSGCLQPRNQLEQERRCGATLRDYRVAILVIAAERSVSRHTSKVELFGHVEDIYFKATDGRTVRAGIYIPPNHKEGREGAARHSDARLDPREILGFRLGSK
jgi:hypothetical protein